MPINPMLFGPGHPIVSFQEWMKFRLSICNLQTSQLTRHLGGSVGRESIELPYWFLPLCRGVILPGPHLFRPDFDPNLASYGWTMRSAEVFERSVGKTRLRVRRTNDGRFWIISRWPPNVRMNSDRRSETIVHQFGSTPLVTETLIEGLHLAYWFQTNDPVGGLRWAKVSPAYLVGAIQFADRRARSEGLTISWNDLWASSAHSRRMKKKGARYRNGQLLPPCIVRLALGTSLPP
jgi:hypothetical protein